ncbi:MAG TPA: hypothetical protein PK569_02140, partial [Thermoanaerobaculia bacterium]|nr:hypothetical protein [Thermoanaerobaculia bacterium]
GCGDSRLGTPEGIGNFLSEDPAGDVDSPNRYAYVGWRPNEATDPTGQWAEAAVFEIPSLALGLSSLRSNLKEERYGAAAIDLLGVVVDTAALLAPGVPGGVGFGLKAARAVDRLQTVDQLVNVGQGLYQAKEALNEGREGWAAFNFGMSVLGVATVGRNTGFRLAPAGGVNSLIPGAVPIRLLKRTAPLPALAPAAAHHAQILQDVVDRVSARLAADPRVARTVLSRAEYELGETFYWISHVNYGKAVERMTRDAVFADPALNNLFKHVGGPFRPDFVGRLGAAAGLRFEITTQAAAAAHLRRRYGAGLNLVTYGRPAGFGLFPHIP